MLFANGELWSDSTSRISVTWLNWYFITIILYNSRKKATYKKFFSRQIALICMVEEKYRTCMQFFNPIYKETI